MQTQQRMQTPDHRTPLRVQKYILLFIKTPRGTAVCFGDQAKEQKLCARHDLLFANKNGNLHLVVDFEWFVVCICVSDHINSLLMCVLHSPVYEGAYMCGVNHTNIAH